MFNLVGSENFRVSDKLATVTITSEGLSFVYSLEVAGKALKTFIETNNKQMRTWLPEVAGDNHRIVLGKSHSCAVWERAHHQAAYM